jgi:hypothetical protein
MTTNKQNLLDKTKGFYKNNKKVSIIILVVIAWMLLGLITVALIGSSSNDSDNNYSDISYDESYVCNDLLSRGDKDSFHSPSYMIDGKICSEIGYEWTDEAEATYQKNEAEKANNSTSSDNSPVQAPVQPEKPDLGQAVRVACQTAWYNDGGDSDQETYWGVNYRNDKDINDHILSAEFPVYMFSNPDSVFGWYSCEYDYANNKVVQITDVDYGTKLY